MAAGRKQLALARQPNLAARLQGLAAPDTVVISAPPAPGTGLLCLRGPRHAVLKGFDTPVQVFGCRARAGADRLDGPRQRLTPLVGRDQELAAAGALGAGPRRSGPGGAAQRRGRHRQVAPGAALSARVVAEARRA